MSPGFVRLGLTALTACVSFSLANGSSQAYRPQEPDIPYTSACGPIAVLMAKRTLGVVATLDDSIKQCRWTDGSMTNLATLLEALRASPSLDAWPVRLSPDHLARFVDRGGVAILPVRKCSERPEHAICVIGTAGGDFVYFDYPLLTQTVTRAAIADVWDGQALLVSRRGLLGFEFNPAWLILPIFSLAIALTDFFGNALLLRNSKA